MPCDVVPRHQAVNTELKELQRGKPELWDAETSYLGGVVRRTVNPFHVIELVPLLKVSVGGYRVWAVDGSIEKGGGGGCGARRRRLAVGGSHTTPMF